MSNEEQKYCISARDRHSGITESITEPMTKEEARRWMATGRKHGHRTHVYFRISKHPFKTHKKS